MSLNLHEVGRVLLEGNSEVREENLVRIGEDFTVGRESHYKCT